MKSIQKSTRPLISFLHCTSTMTTPEPEIDTATPAATAVEPLTAAPSTGVESGTATAAPTASVKADKADGTAESTPTPTPHAESLHAHPLGLSREALEQEVGQVMGTLSSWWGGVKKQVSLYLMLS
jgi:hypothetical protein